MISAISWAATLASIAGVVLNIRRNRVCFFVWAATNAFWCGLDLWHGIYSQAALQTVYFGLAIWGIREWKTAKLQGHRP